MKKTTDQPPTTCHCFEDAVVSCCVMREPLGSINGGVIEDATVLSKKKKDCLEIHVDSFAPARGGACVKNVKKKKKM